jgi:3-oxoadipate enol-lactonase
MSSGRTHSGIALDVTGEGPAVLLIHAGIADRRMWDPQWEAWAGEFTLVRYDLRGIGESDDPRGSHSLHGDALEVLDAAGCDEVAAVGCSVGGRVALDLTLAAPGRVRAVVAANTGPSGWDMSTHLGSFFEEVERAYAEGGIEAANEAEVRGWVDGPGRERAGAEPAARGRVAEMNAAVLAREEAQERAGTAIAPTPLDPPALGRMAELQAPLLVVVGEHDQPAINAAAAQMAQAAGAPLVEISATAHLPSLERPAAFDAAVVSFLGAQSSNSA